MIIACAVTLAVIVIITASFIAYNLRTRAMSENAQALSSSALIVAKQIEQTFTAVQAVQQRFRDDLSVLPVVDGETITREYSRHAVHLKLRDKAAGMPYVGSLAIVDAKGRLINFSRLWPIPDVNISGEDYFRTLKGSSRFTSLWRPSPDSVEIVISEFSRIVLPFSSTQSGPSSRRRKYATSRIFMWAWARRASFFFSGSN